MARITRPGQLAAARKEVTVSRWLTSLGIPVVEALPEVDQPMAVDGRAVTFWREFPDHRYSTPTELATVLRRLHMLPRLDLYLPAVTPFVRLRQRITQATGLGHKDRDWLLHHLAELEAHFADLAPSKIVQSLLLGYAGLSGDRWPFGMPARKQLLSVASNQRVYDGLARTKPVHPSLVRSQSTVCRPHSPPSTRTRSLTVPATQ